MDCSVYYFRHLYSAGSACVLLTIIAWDCPSIWAALSALLINILLGSFQLFLHSDLASLWGEIIPFSGVCQSGRLRITPGVSSFTPFVMLMLAICPSVPSSRETVALASANSFVYFASSAATSRWRICMSVIAFASFQFSGILSRWAL